VWWWGVVAVVVEEEEEEKHTVCYSLYFGKGFLRFLRGNNEIMKSYSKGLRKKGALGDEEMRR
jgi:hypothetical protein